MGRDVLRSSGLLGHLHHFDLIGLHLQEVTPAVDNQLTVDVVLRRVDFVLRLLKLVDVDLAESPLAHLASGLDEVRHRGDVLVEVGDSVDVVAEFVLVVAVLLVENALDGIVDLVCTDLLVQLHVLKRHFLALSHLLTDVGRLNDAARHANQSVDEAEITEVVVRGDLKLCDELSAVGHI